MSLLASKIRQQRKAEAAAPTVHAPAVRSQAPSPPSSPEMIRRWDAARTDRLNSAHWSYATGQHINADLSADLETLRHRCEWEAENNPTLKGVIHTYVTDVVGPDGPTLQVQSDSSAFNDWLEDHVSAIFDAIDVEGRMDMADMIRLGLRGLWTGGELLRRYVHDGFASTPAGLRLQAIHPRRLVTPAAMSSDDAVVMGVRRNSFGRPTQFYIDTSVEGEFGLYSPLDVEPISADLVQHEFDVIEPGQVRGVPMAAAGLQVLADLKDADEQILDSIRQAADSGVLLHSTDPDSAPLNIVGTSVDIERRQITAVPPGWTPMQVEPTQPGTNVLEYRSERMREIGLPAGMPLMKIKRDAQGLNFSQAKFGFGDYWRSIESRQRKISRRELNPLVMMIERETRLAQMVEGKRVPRRPENFKLLWGWNPPPKMDPRLEAMATVLERGVGKLSLTDMLAGVNKTVEQHAEQIAKERAVYAAAGVPYPEANDARAMIELMEKLAEAENENAEELEPANA